MKINKGSRKLFRVGIIKRYFKNGKGIKRYF